MAKRKDEPEVELICNVEQKPSLFENEIALAVGVVVYVTAIFVWQTWFAKPTDREEDDYCRK